MKLTREMEQYVVNSQQEIRQLIRDLCAIPAPSHHEEKRAAFCKAWFDKNGMQGAQIDVALNVICPFGVTGDNPLTVFMAHTDTVFPDLEPMPFAEEEGKMYSPGVTDDTASLAVLMVCARYVVKNCRPGKTGLLFVANSGEEGLGNLKGSRKIIETYGPRIREFITLDGTNLCSLVTRAVGSHRYRVVVRTEGGHSYSAFGNRNAIVCLSNLISTLYSVKVPTEGDSKTTYNVGLISGGTSVNTIAQQAEMLYEYRSDSLSCLQKMEDMFHKVIEAYRSTGLDIAVEKIGDRPCSGKVDPARQQALIDRVSDSIRRVTSRETLLRSGSTDANMPLSVGIPALCMSVCKGGRCHTREEWLDVESLLDGSRLFLDFLSEYVGENK